MPRKKTKRGKPDAKKSEDPRHRLDKALEEGLEETFPASDAVAVVEPAPLPSDDIIRSPTMLGVHFFGDTEGCYFGRFPLIQSQAAAAVENPDRHRRAVCFVCNSSKESTTKQL